MPDLLTDTAWLPRQASVTDGHVEWSEPYRFPKYPIYVLSKGRAATPYTIKFLQLDEVPFRVVVVPEEVDEYAKIVEESQLLVLPRGDLKLLGTRNWVRDHAESEGWDMHWQLDDNIRRVYRLWRYAQRIPCDSGPAFRAVEDLVDRYVNVGIAGMNYKMFGLPNLTPYFINTHVYSCTLVNHANPYRWRLVYNDDTDFCLQTLGSQQWCTVLVNVFLADKLPTMTVKGGNTNELYSIGEGAGEGLYSGDGRRIMARELERMWPGVVTVERRFQRPQHVIDWKRFKQPLVRRLDVDVPDGVDDYGLRLIQVSDIKSDVIRRLFDEAGDDQAGGPIPPRPPADLQLVGQALSADVGGLVASTQDDYPGQESPVHDDHEADSSVVEGGSVPRTSETLLEGAHDVAERSVTAGDLARARLDNTDFLTDFDRFLDLCADGDADVDLIRHVAPELVSHYKGAHETRVMQELEDRWYASLRDGKPDWTIYGDDLYIADLWACWTVYSRRYLRDLTKPSLLDGRSVYDDIGPVESVCDLGCGIGYSTAAVKTLWPSAEAYGTNLLGLRQTSIAKLVGEKYGFTVHAAIMGEVDLVFASEYFEHFEEPVRHLREVVEVGNSRVVIAASTFGSASPGHFPLYRVGDEHVDGRQTASLFSRVLRDLGYQKIHTKLWNNRPSYWVRQEEANG